MTMLIIKNSIWYSMYDWYYWYNIESTINDILSSDDIKYQNIDKVVKPTSIWHCDIVTSSSYYIFYTLVGSGSQSGSKLGSHPSKRICWARRDPGSRLAFWRWDSWNIYFENKKKWERKGEREMESTIIKSEVSVINYSVI